MSRQPSAAQSRREMMIRSAAALAVAGVATPGFAFAKLAFTRTPGMTLGPYFLSGMPNRRDIRANTPTGAVETGLPLQLALTVASLASDGTISPVPNAVVDIWHASWQGRYSGFASEGTTGQNFLRGFQVTNARGSANFVTVYPGWYNGRTQHIHMRVRTYNGTTVTYDFVSQLFLDDAITDIVYALAPYNTRGVRGTDNDNDGIYNGASQGNGGSVASEAGDYTLLRLGNNNTRANASFTIVL